MVTSAGMADRCCPATWSVRSIVISTGQNPNLVITDLVYQPMLAINSPRPAARQLVAQRFRLADATKRVALDVLDQSKES